MVSGTLYTYPDSYRAYKALIAARYSGADIKTAECIIGQTNKSEEFLQKFPLGKVPALETNDKKYIWESNAIAHYVSNEALRGGKCPLAQAQVQQWISLAESDILPAACVLTYPLLGISKYIKPDVEAAKKQLQRALDVLDKHLLHCTYLVGERITLADITMACHMLLLYKHYLEPAARAQHPNVSRWYLTCINQPQYKAVLGEVALCSQAPQYEAGKGAKQGGKQEKPKQEKQQQPKQEKPKQEKAAKQEKEELDEADMILAQESKQKDPFDQYPKGNFDMDAFKRCYSNSEEAVSVAYFWEHFDKENYSIWYSEYKYPEELALIYMSCNLIGGMFQRLDKMRKHAFASVLLFGEDNKSSISGIWIWRGHDLAFTLSDNWQVDYESYDWKKLDPESEETKKMVNAYLAWDGDFGGKKLNQGKIFK